jgi:uncharacterized membrane protein
LWPPPNPLASAPVIVTANASSAAIGAILDLTMRIMSFTKRTMAPCPADAAHYSE